jgi:hypothetical protein
MLAREVQVADRLRLVVSDRREVSGMVTRIASLHERVGGPVLKVNAKKIVREARGRGECAGVDKIEVIEEGLRLRLNRSEVEPCAPVTARVVRQYRVKIRGLCRVCLPSCLVVRKIRVRPPVAPLSEPRTPVEADHHLGVGSVAKLVDCQ